MTLPVRPDVDTILEACIETLREVVVPEVDSDWGRYSGELLIGSLEYARGLLHEDRNAEHRAALARAVHGLRATVETSAGPEWRAAFEDSSPFETASRLLVAAQNDPGPLADEVRGVLHAVLRAPSADGWRRWCRGNPPGSTHPVRQCRYRAPGR